MALKNRITPKRIFKVFKTAVQGFIDDKVPKLSGSLAYATIFSLAPLFVIILTVVDWLYGKEAVEGKMYAEISGFVGPDVAAQLQQIISNASLSGRSGFSMAIGVITLIIGATSVFAEIQDSINSIWGIKPKPKRGWLRMLKNRFLSFSLIISLGFLLLVSLSISSLLDAFSRNLAAQYPDVTIVFFYILNLVINFIVISFLFAIIFKLLPDANIKWRNVMAGSITTALLFMLAKFLISFYISTSNISTTYGTAASIIILLTWIYFSAFILYFGSQFTKAWAVEFGHKIYPRHYAVSTKIVEVEQEGEAVEAINKANVEATAGEEVKDKVNEQLENGIPQDPDEKNKT